MRPTIKDLRKVTHEKDPVCDHGGYTTVTRSDLLAALGLVTECEECGGTGTAGVHRHTNYNTGEHLGDEPIPCPSCDGLGWQVAPELVELVYQTNLAAGRENAEQLLRQVLEEK
jgi:DnaJ-class molecular chaperone